MIGALIIGDEITRGRRQDKHFTKTIELLAARGMHLDWAQYIGDDPALIIATLKRTLASGDIVFSFGGIGSTPDDHTRRCAAEARGVPLKLHADAEAEIRARFGAEITPQRLKMGEFPEDSRIIPNPYNRIPGFSVGDHHFVPGFPIMAWPMLEWVLDTHYAHLFNAVPEAYASVLAHGLAESQITPLMLEVEAKYPGMKSFSLPTIAADGSRGHIELGVRGTPEDVEPAMDILRKGVDALGGRWEPRS